MVEVVFVVLLLLVVVAAAVVVVVVVVVVVAVAAAAVIILIVASAVVVVVVVASIWPEILEFSVCDIFKGLTSKGFFSLYFFFSYIFVFSASPLSFISMWSQSMKNHKEHYFKSVKRKNWQLGTLYHHMRILGEFMAQLFDCTAGYNAFIVNIIILQGGQNSSVASVLGVLSCVMWRCGFDPLSFC